MLYQVTQHDVARGGSDYGDANLTAFGGARATLGRATLHGEWLVDDIQIDAKDRKTYPNLFGWLFEGTYALPLPRPTVLGVQYRRIDSYTYSKKLYSEVYQQYDQPLGSELGPDADYARGYAELWGTGRLRLVGGIARWRHGAQRIDQRPSVDRKGHAGEPFPSVTAARPDVQRAWVGDAGVDWLDGVVPVSLTVELARVTNVDNLPAPAQNYGRLRLQVSYRFRYP
jgi:hypothetical protein